MSKEVHVTSGLGLGSALFLVLLVLKLTGIGIAATMSWPLVVSSLFWPAGVALGIAGVSLLIAGFGVVLGTVIDKLARGGVGR